MGCTFAHPRSSDNSDRIFKVLNVDSEGHKRNPGKIEITDQELILHQKGETPIKWPLRSLRRYGFDAQLFSFESGRRCPTGVGIYAFQCQRAEALFNLLQECIERAGQDDQQGGGGGGGRSAVPTSNFHPDRPVSSALVLDNNNVIRSSNNTSPPTMIIRSSGNAATTQGVSIITGNGPVSLQTFPSMSSPNAHEYINTDILQNGHAISNNDAGEPVVVIDTSDVNVHIMQQNSCVQPTDSGIQYAQLDLHRESIDNNQMMLQPYPSPPPPPPTVAVDSDSSQAMYINVTNSQSLEINGNNNNKPRSSSLTTTQNQPPLMRVKSEDHHDYSNLGFSNVPAPPKKYASSSGGALHSLSSNHPMGDGGAGAGYENSNNGKSECVLDPKVNYIEVAFKNNDGSNAAVGSSSGMTTNGGSNKHVNGFSNGADRTNGNCINKSASSNGGHSSFYNNNLVIARGASTSEFLAPLPKTQLTESYAVIDFDKTAAINAKHVTKDDGVRKTRHNSSIEELQ